MRRGFIPVLVLIAGVCAAGTALAQGYPARQVRIVDPFVPGAITTITARLIARKFQEQTGQPMVLDHRPGAGTNIGGELVARAPADGYTLLIGTSSLAINPALHKHMPFDPIKDLAPVALLVRTPNVLAVAPSLPVRTVQELVEYARANPDKLNYASSGYGATNHLSMEMFRAMTRTRMQHIPFKGGAEAISALLAGQVQLMFSPESTVGAQHRAGTARIIAVGAEQRLENFPAIPTVAESGVPGFESGVWLALFAPAGTPDTVIEKLNAEVNAALKDAAVRQVLRGAGLTPVGGRAADLREVLARDTERMRGVVKASGASID